MCTAINLTSGALWMFFSLQRTMKGLEKEIDKLKKKEDDNLQNYLGI